MRKKPISIIWIVLCLMLFTVFMWCLTFFDAVYNVNRYFMGCLTLFLTALQPYDVDLTLFTAFMWCLTLFMAFTTLIDIL